MWLWNSVIVPAWTGIRDFIAAAWNFIRGNIWTPIVNFLSGVLAPAFVPWRDSGERDLEHRPRRDQRRRVFIRDNVWQPMVNFVTVTVPDARSAGGCGRGRPALGWDQEGVARPDPGRDRRGL